MTGVEPTLPDQGATPIPEPLAEAPPTAIIAGWGRRFAAYLIDSLILGLVSIVSSVIYFVRPQVSVAPFAPENIGWWLVLTLLSALPTVTYFALSWSRWGQTPAMALLGLQVVRSMDGTRISGWRAIGRYFAFILASLPLFLGLLWALWDRQRRGWHDMLAGTLVIRIPSLQESGRGTARGVVVGATIVGGLLSIVGGVVVFAASLGAAFGGVRDADGRLLAPALIVIDAVQVGDCFDLLEGEIVFLVQAGPCADPHVHEAFAMATLDDGAFPGQSAIDQLAFGRCLPFFANYVGIEYDLSAWYIYYLGPTQESWSAGDRTVICTLVNEQLGEVTGSARGSGR